MGEDRIVYTLAHEIAHGYLHKDTGNTVDSPKHAEYEEQADRAAHMILDLFTKEGIELLYPIDINFSLMPIKTNSKTEKLICKVLSFIVIFLLGYRFYILI